MKMVLRIFGELVWLVVAVAIVGSGWFGYQYLGANKTVVEAKPIERTVPVVRVANAEPLKTGIPISANGFITAARSLDIAAQASGRLIYVHPAINDRGTFKEGDVLFQLDNRQAKASVAQINANIQSANAQRRLVIIQLERAKDLRDKEIIAQDRLDQLETQRQEVDANLASLNANLQSAEVSLSNTIVTAPFDGRVLEKRAEAGAVLAQGAPVAQIYASDSFEVEIAIREDEAVLIEDLFSNPSGDAYVESRFAGQTFRWNAAIARADRRIDAQTRTIDLTLALLNPDNGRSISSETVNPALINAFVSATILARPLDEVFVVQTAALRANNSIWIAKGDVLEIMPVRVLYQNEGIAYIAAGGITNDTPIISSPLAVARNGMTIRVEADTASLTN